MTHISKAKCIWMISLIVSDSQMTKFRKFCLKSKGKVELEMEFSQNVIQPRKQHRLASAEFLTVCLQYQCLMHSLKMGKQMLSIKTLY